MTFYWIYDLPNWQIGLMIISVCVITALAGLFLLRPLVKGFLGASDRYNELVSWVFAGICVFYGLAVGLIAVGTWENFSEVDDQISNESALIAGLYNDLDGYAPPIRAKLEAAMQNYTKAILEKDWPAHRLGEQDPLGSRLLDQFENDVMEFKPGDERDKILHAAVIKSLDDVVEARRIRLGAVETGLPAALWVVVLIGAILNTMLLYLYWVENLALHACLVTIFATFIGLLLFLTAVMDNPYRGQFSVSPEKYQKVLDEVMGPAR